MRRGPELLYGQVIIKIEITMLLIGSGVGYSKILM